MSVWPLCVVVLSGPGTLLPHCNVFQLFLLSIFDHFLALHLFLTNFSSSLFHFLHSQNICYMCANAPCIYERINCTSLYRIMYAILYLCILALCLFVPILFFFFFDRECAIWFYNIEFMYYTMPYAVRLHIIFFDMTAS